MPRSQKLDPLRNFKFIMQIPDFSGSTGWSRISGLKESTEVVEYREGTDHASPRKLFGQTTYDPITCERGITTDFDLLQWRSQVKEATHGSFGQNEGTLGGEANIRQDVEIRALEYHGRKGVLWVADNAWPSSMEFGELGGDGNDVLLETMEMVHEGLTASYNQALPSF